MDVAASPRTVLVVGSGGREHALAWRLAGETGVDRVLVAPGNPGMADVATTVPDIPASDAAAIAELAARESVDLVVVGPEAPLVAGLADVLVSRGLAVFGPGKERAALEGSKAFCRAVATAAGVAMAEGAAYDEPIAAMRAARAFGGRVVVKADGLAAGKGVTVCDDADQAEAAIRAAMIEGAFGAAGRRVIVERALEGREVSVIVITDGVTALALPAARDHKRLSDGDQGPNTGGMGAYSSPDDVSDELLTTIVEGIHDPVLAELRRFGPPFRGALYAGLMLTADGPRLLEFNVRFGDPETQALLPLLDVPLGALMAAASRHGLPKAARALGIKGRVLPSRAGSTVAVVVAAPGYPSAPQLGARIEGLDDAKQTGAHVFCAGVSADDEGRLATAGGRVLSVVGLGPDLGAAADHAYMAADRIRFPGRHFRRDIGRAATSRQADPIPVAAG